MKKKSYLLKDENRGEDDNEGGQKKKKKLEAQMDLTFMRQLSKEFQSGADDVLLKKNNK